MKVLFLDRRFHGITGSSNFFETLLKEFFDVEKRYVDGELIENLIKGHSPDDTIILLWQCEILAPLLRQMGYACMLVPMWDGVSTLGRKFWKCLAGLPAISFSYTLYNKMQHNGLRPLNVQYAPDPEQYPQVQDYVNKKFFFWYRGHGEAMDGFSAARLALGHQAEISIHQADRMQEHPLNYLGLYKEPRLTEWFPSRDAYIQYLSEHNLFFAPRLNEGIGFGFLDAMACGLVVVGWNNATMNEYIKNGVNGILSDNLLSPALNLKLYDSDEHFANMGRAARETVSQAHKNWKHKNIQTVINYIKYAFDELRNKRSKNAISKDLMDNLQYSLVDIDDLIRIADM